MKRISDFFRVLSTDITEDGRRQCSKNVAMSVIVCISAGIMLIMNIIRHATLMTITSVILVVGFAFTGILAGVFRKGKAWRGRVCRTYLPKRRRSAEKSRSDEGICRTA